MNRRREASGPGPSEPLDPAHWGVAPHAQGAVLAVRAQPGARTNGLRGLQDGSLKVSVVQVAERGKANQALIEVLAESLGLKRQQIDLLTGATGSSKRFLVREIDPGQLAARVRAALPGAS